MHNHGRPLHSLFFQYFNHKELDELYLSVFLKSLALSMITIFIPIYFLQLDFTISAIALYYLTFFLFLPFTMTLGMSLLSRYGIKHIMAVGTFLAIPHLYFLDQMKEGISFLFPVVFGALSVGLYYAAFHLEFVQALVKKKEGTQVSMMKVMMLVGSTLGPYIGSLFITHYSFRALFFLVSLLLAASSAPLFLTPDTRIPLTSLALKEILRADTRVKGLTYSAEGLLLVVGGIFWPLLIYLTLGTVVSLGIIVSLSSLFAALCMLAIGSFSDTHPHHVLRVGVLTKAPLWIARLFFLTPLGIFLMDFFATLSGSAILIAFEKIMYQQARRVTSMVHYFLFRELHLTFGRVLILFVALFTTSFYWMFFVAFIATFAWLLLPSRT